MHTHDSAKHLHCAPGAVSWTALHEPLRVLLPTHPQPRARMTTSTQPEAALRGHSAHSAAAPHPWLGKSQPSGAPPVWPVGVGGGGGGQARMVGPQARAGGGGVQGGRLRCEAAASRCRDLSW